MLTNRQFVAQRHLFAVQRSSLLAAFIFHLTLFLDAYNVCIRLYCFVRVCFCVFIYTIFSPHEPSHASHNNDRGRAQWISRDFETSHSQRTIRQYRIIRRHAAEIWFKMYEIATFVCVCKARYWNAHASDAIEIDISNMCHEKSCAIQKKNVDPLIDLGTSEKSVVDTIKCSRFVTFSYDMGIQKCQLRIMF